MGATTQVTHYQKNYGNGRDLFWAFHSNWQDKNCAQNKKSREECLLLTDTLPRVAFVSAGQLPRKNMMEEILELIGCDFVAEEYGALDDLDEYELELMRPGEKDQGIYTRLRDGSSIVVAVSPLEIRIANVCAELDHQEFDLIVVLSTCLYNEIRTYTPLLHTQRVIDTWFASVSMTECHLGVVTPLAKQGQSTREHMDDLMKCQTTYLLGHKNSHIAETAQRLNDCELIFMNSISYKKETAERLSAFSGLPVVTARKVLANALHLYLSYLMPRSGRHLNNVEERLQAAAPNLTKREREIVKLVVQGFPNKKIGLKLGISHRTVEKHRSSAMSKLGVFTISALMQFVLMLQ
jgi:protein AroM